MSGKRRPMEVNLESGGKHWSAAEIAKRRAEEVLVAKPKRLRCPSWLDADAAKLFRTYGKLLVENLPVSELDTATLARMCDAEIAYSRAAKMRDAAFARINEHMLTVDNDGSTDEGLEAAKADYAFWCKALSLSEKTARGAASDLGCTISSRCRMVVPEKKKEEEDPLEALERSISLV